MMFAESRRKPVCRVCGRELRGVTLDYKNRWTCSDCAEDKEGVLFCETGSKVVAAHLDWGMMGDIEQAEKYLKQGKTYVVDSLHIGGSFSYLTLKKFPDVYFNSVHFERVN